MAARESKSPRNSRFSWTGYGASRPGVAGYAFLIVYAWRPGGAAAVAGALARAGVMSLFTAVFAAVSGWPAIRARRCTGHEERSLGAGRTLTVSITPLPVLLRGFEMTGAPRFLLMVAQFLDRYLFVISEEAQQMQSQPWRAAPPWADWPAMPRAFAPPRERLRYSSRVPTDAPKRFTGRCWR